MWDTSYVGAFPGIYADIIETISIRKRKQFTLSITIRLQQILRDGMTFLEERGGRGGVYSYSHAHVPNVDRTHWTRTHGKKNSSQIAFHNLSNFIQTEWCLNAKWHLSFSQPQNRKISGSISSGRASRRANAYEHSAMLVHTSSAAHTLSNTAKYCRAATERQFLNQINWHNSDKIRKIPRISLTHRF